MFVITRKISAIQEFYPMTFAFVGLVIARRPKADVAISYPSKAEPVPVPKCPTMMPKVSIVIGCLGAPLSRAYH